MVSVNKIMAYEAGEQMPDETAEMFSEMIKDGSVWKLQGHYGRQARYFISEGMIAPDGTIDYDRLHYMAETYGM